MPIIRLGSLSPFDHELITVGAGALPLTATKYAVAAKELAAILTLRDDQMYYYIDGTTADANGNIMNPGDVLILENTDQLQGFSCIRVTADAKLIVNYMKR